MAGFNIGELILFLENWGRHAGSPIATAKSSAIAPRTTPKHKMHPDE
jgi:hypothetical protein